MNIIFPPRNDYSYIPILDLDYRDDCIVVKEIDNKILKFVNLLHTSMKTNRFFELPLKRIWYDFYFSCNEVEEEYVFIFFEGNRLSYDLNYLNYLKRKYKNSVFVFKYLNTAQYIDPSRIVYVEKTYDYIMSFDREDCVNHGWIYCPNTYGSASYSSDILIENDIFFVGQDKGRYDQLVSLAQCLELSNITYDFYVVDRKKESKQKQIKIIKYMNYEVTIKKILSSKCLLEILQESQTGSTLRTFEAIYFDKLLITNNKALLDEDYYDERYMHVYTDLDEATEWLKENLDVDVKYDNKHMISNERIINTINEYKTNIKNI